MTCDAIQVCLHIEGKSAMHAHCNFTIKGAVCSVYLPFDDNNTDGTVMSTTHNILCLQVEWYLLSQREIWPAESGSKT